MLEIIFGYVLGLFGYAAGYRMGYRLGCSVREEKNKGK